MIAARTRRTVHRALGVCALLFVCGFPAVAKAAFVIGPAQISCKDGYVKVFGRVVNQVNGVYSPIASMLVGLNEFDDAACTTPVPKPPTPIISKQLALPGLASFGWKSGDPNRECVVGKYYRGTALGFRNNAGLAPADTKTASARTPCCECQLLIACTLPAGGGCSWMTQSACASASGTAGTTCGTGACLSSDGSQCTVETSAACSSQGGQYVSDDTSCLTETGACLLSSGCTLADEFSCAGQGGSFQGGGTSCGDSTGACTLENPPACIETDSSACATMSGQFQTGGSCPTTGACLSGSVCSITSDTGCSGTFLGSGTYCSQGTGACVINGACVNQNSDVCFNESGGLYQGDGSSCPPSTAPGMSTAATWLLVFAMGIFGLAYPRWADARRAAQGG
jgi:hypothetical protein